MGNITAPSVLTEESGEGDIESEAPEDISQPQEVFEETLFPIHSPERLPSASSPSSQPPQKKQRTLQKEQEEFERTLPPKNTQKTPITIKRSRKHSKQDHVDIDRELLDLEKKKVSLLEKQDVIDNNEDLNFFKSLIPHVSKLPSLNKLFFRNQVQSALMNELAKIQCDDTLSDPRNVRSRATSAASSSVSTPFSLPSPTQPGQDIQQFSQYSRASSAASTSVSIPFSLLSPEQPGENTQEFSQYTVL